MSGHSKWASIKHKKAIVDVKKGKVFSKVSKELSVAAKMGGGDPGMNPRLRLAVDKAKDSNMPADNIKKAIMKGTGELPGVSYEETVYEGYGPGGVALIIDVLTDNKNRTISELRNVMSKNSGNIGESGCVAWIFDKKGYILVDKKTIDEDVLMSVALDAGADDVKNMPDEDSYEIITSPEEFNRIRDFLKQNKIELKFSEVTMIPKNYVKLEADDAKKMIKLMNILEEHDDIQNVYANFDIPEDIL